jgi:hypothetical protein
MKFKDIFSPALLIVLGSAFLLVSLWVFVSKNKNAIRYKYKLGGMILSLSFFSSCGTAPQVTCYDLPPTCYVVIQPNFVYPAMPTENVSLNDSLFFYIASPTYGHYSYLLTDSVSKQEFQQGFLEYSENNYTWFLPLKDIPEEYKGKFLVKIFGEKSAEEMKQEENLADGLYFILN